MKLELTDKFKTDFMKLTDNVRNSAAKQITQLLLDHKHP